MNAENTDRQTNQWKIERVWQEDRELILRCQADLRALGTALHDGKVLLKDMRFNLNDRRDVAQLAQIGQATRGTNDLPGGLDRERWTGTEFTASVIQGKGLQIARVDEPGQYRLWIPPAAASLYARVQKGKDLGLCDPTEAFIGGGTILTARWRHRTSTDIDIFWREERWSPKEENWRLKKWLALIDEEPTRAMLASGVNKIEWDGGDTDFIATRVLELGERRDPVVGTELTACTTGEILAGKIIGRALIPYRDVFDAAVAVLKEPQALQKALRIAMQDPVRGTTGIERIPEYCRRISANGDWERQRGDYIHEPACIEAWANGPMIVAEAVGAWQRARNQTQEMNGWER